MLLCQLVVVGSGQVEEVRARKWIERVNEKQTAFFHRLQGTKVVSEFLSE